MTRPSASRPARARALPALGLLLAALAPAGRAAADPLASPASGLAWPSGAKSNLSCLAQLRGRAIDVTHVDVAPPSFGEMVQSSAGWVRLAAMQAPTALLSFALLPARNKGQFAECARGAFDGYWRQIGANLAKIRGHKIIVEPGWEANIGSGSHPWGVDAAAQLPAYKACFRRAAA